MPKHFNRWQDVPADYWRWPNFTPKELACKGTGELLVDEEALDKLQELRQRIGKPLQINSAYRSAKHNKAVGGSPNSQHLHGRAFDISLATVTPLELVKHAKAAGFTGIGRYDTFVHVDTGPAREWDLRKRP
jgi:zinc D-Ala-D-Ala carboxypeptidase